MSVDPYMRGRMNDVKSYVPPFQLGAPLDGGAIGEVVASEADRPAPSATWCCTGSAGGSTRVLDAAAARQVDPERCPAVARTWACWA